MLFRAPLFAETKMPFGRWRGVLQLIEQQTRIVGDVDLGIYTRREHTVTGRPEGLELSRRADVA